MMRRLNPFVMEARVFNSMVEIRIKFLVIKKKRAENKEARS